MGRRKHGGRAATKVDGFEWGQVLAGVELSFGDERFDEGIEVGLAGSVLVK